MCSTLLKQQTTDELTCGRFASVDKENHIPGANASETRASAQLTTSSSPTTLVDCSSSPDVLQSGAPHSPLGDPRNPAGARPLKGASVFVMTKSNASGHMHKTLVDGGTDIQLFPHFAHRTGTTEHTLTGGDVLPKLTPFEGEILGSRVAVGQQLEDALRCRVGDMNSALRRSNANQAELQKLLEQTLNRCERLQDAEAEAQRLIDHHRQRWGLLDQECEALKAIVQQAQAAERDARSTERSSLHQARVWRCWLAKLLDILLKIDEHTLNRERCESIEHNLPVHHHEARDIMERLTQGRDTDALIPQVDVDLQNLVERLEERLERIGVHAIRGNGSCRAQDDEQCVPVATCGAKGPADPSPPAAIDFVSKLKRDLLQKEATISALEHDRRILQAEVRSLQNVVQELKGSIRVFCRVRPSRCRETHGNLEGSLGSGVIPAMFGARVDGSQSVSLRKPPGDRQLHFLFDRVFAPNAGQETVYEEVQPLLRSVVDGQQLCIFAYGQTGSGKTYTLAGSAYDRDPGNLGIQSRAIADLWQLATHQSNAASKGGGAVAMHLTALEIYNESIRDLLTDESSGNPRRASLDVRHSGEHAYGADVPGLCVEADCAASSPSCSLPSAFGSMRVPGLHTIRLRGPEDIETTMRLVEANRHVAATMLNEVSSRSHCVISVCIVPQRAHSESSDPRTSCGVMHFVDLAGSERTKTSQVDGQHMREANYINKSLSSLTDVLSALGDATSSHIPYRNSKLTYLLQDALGGPGCKALLFAQISPDAADVHETYSTLLFASKVATSIQKRRLRPAPVVATRSAPVSNGSITGSSTNDWGGICWSTGCVHSAKAVSTVPQACPSLSSCGDLNSRRESSGPSPRAASTTRSAVKGRSEMRGSPSKVVKSPQSQASELGDAHQSSQSNRRSVSCRSNRRP